MSVYLKSLLLSSSIISFAVPVMAAETGNTGFEEIIVSASRRTESTSDVGASISVLSDEALARGQYSFALDALQRLPGVSVNQNGAYGGTATVRIRGASSDQTMILVDGVQINDPSAPGGGFNYGTLDSYGIDRIEVLKGPQAVLYGSDAIGGVVNILTKIGEEEQGGGFFLESGSYGTARAGASLHGGNGKVGYNLTASAITTDGISKADKRDGNTEKDGRPTLSIR